MKKQTKLKIVRIATGAAVCLSAVGIIMLCGRSSTTSRASQFTHGLKVIGEAFGGGMYRGATVVAGAGVVASEVMDSAANYVIPDDVVAQAAGYTPPPAASQPVDPEPLFSQFNNMTEYMTALREWQARQPDAEDDIVAQYDRWEEAQRAQRPRHPMWERGRVVSLAEVRNKSPLDYLSDDELDEAI